MKRLVFYIVPLLATSLLITGCGTPGSYQESYSTTGAIIGGSAGAIIGATQGWPLEGAAAGALIGGAAGAAAGADVDQKVTTDAQNQAYLQAQADAAANPPVSKMDVISMSRAEVSEDVIITKIQVASYVQPLNAHDVIELKHEGVSDRVTKAMLEKARDQSNIVFPPPPPETSAVGPAPGAVTTYYYSDPAPYAWNLYFGWGMPWSYYYGPRWPYYYRHGSPYPGPWFRPGPRPWPGPGPRPGPRPHPGPPR